MPKTTSFIAAALLAPTLLLAGCSGNNADERSGDTQNGAKGSETAASAPATPGGKDGSRATSPAGTGGAATPGAPREAAKDVKVSKCEIKNGSAVVEATVKNSDSAEANYIIPVEVQQGGKKVDGVAVFVPSVPAGKEAKGEMQGNSAGLKGKVTCKIGDVQAM